MQPVLVHLLALRSLRLQSYVLSTTFPNLLHLTCLSLHSVRFASPTGFSKFMSDFPQLRCLALEEISFVVEVKDEYASDQLALPELEALSVCCPEMLRLLFDVSPCDVLIRTPWHNTDQDRFQHIPVYLRRLGARLQCLQLSCYVSSQIMELAELDFTSSTGLCRLRIDHALLFNEIDSSVELLSMNPGVQQLPSNIAAAGELHRNATTLASWLANAANGMAAADGDSGPSRHAAVHHQFVVPAAGAAHALGSSLRWSTGPQPGVHAHAYAACAMLD
ncbi:hypothetical protein C8J57DRAFT_1514421 [Mycena rebaudengoi]|nr:hypothetical protein C8J57DRAFT_1514421 [Mycena rebaudengoi]